MRHMNRYYTLGEWSMKYADRRTAAIHLNVKYRVYRPETLKFNASVQRRVVARGLGGTGEGLGGTEREREREIAERLVVLVMRICNVVHLPHRTVVGE